MFRILKIKVFLERNYATYHEEVRASGGSPPRSLNLYHVEVTNLLQASAVFIPDLRSPLRPGKRLDGPTDSLQ